MALSPTGSHTSARFVD
jgi:hypothetical protein